MITGKNNFLLETVPKKIDVIPAEFFMPRLGAGHPRMDENGFYVKLSHGFSMIGGRLLAWCPRARAKLDPDVPRHSELLPQNLGAR